MRKLILCALLFLVIPLGGGTCGTAPVGEPLPDPAIEAVKKFDGTWTLDFIFQDQAASTICVDLAGGKITRVQNGCRLDTVLVDSIDLVLDEFARVTFSATAQASTTDGTPYTQKFYFSGIGDRFRLIGTVRMIVISEGITQFDQTTDCAFSRH